YEVCKEEAIKKLGDMERRNKRLFPNLKLERQKKQLCNCCIWRYL
ncbi:hypothetical protein Csa_023868, partial [Cucumis sativus]